MPDIVYKVSSFEELKSLLYKETDRIIENKESFNEVLIVEYPEYSVKSTFLNLYVDDGETAPIGTTGVEGSITDEPNNEDVEIELEDVEMEPEDEGSGINLLLQRAEVSQYLLLLLQYLKEKPQSRLPKVLPPQQKLQKKRASLRMLQPGHKLFT